MMNNKSITSSNLSLDSLEMSFTKRCTGKQLIPSEKVDTILVPFYEKDVLIKVPKGPIKTIKNLKKSIKKDKARQDIESTQSYLMNKDSQKCRKTSYLQMFRKQFSPICNPIKHDCNNEIRSISPEFGDTERESIGETNASPTKDFYNTESYNEIYYEKLMNQEISQYLEHTFEQALHFTEDIRSKSPDDITNNNFKSVSEVSQPRRPLRRATVEPIQNVHLGGLGPDMENIKPRLERARSLQRYSEKVRMENRLKIYRKTIEADNEKKSARETSARQRIILKKEKQESQNSSYLVNKSLSEKSALVKKTCTKSKSADPQSNRRKEKQIKLKTIKADSKNVKDENLISSREIKKPAAIYTESTQNNNKGKSKGKSSARSHKTEANENDAIPPVQISFLVNVGGVRPSTALRSLEEKHIMYQEKIKAMENNNF